MLSVSRAGLGRQFQPSTFARTSFFARSFIIPQLPGGVAGNVNDAYVPPKPAKSHGSLHWTTERIVAVGLLPLVGSSFAGSTSAILDTALAAFMLYHVHSGFQAIIIDYIPKRVYGPLHNFAMYLLTFGTGVAGYGIYEIEQKEEGGVAGVVSRVFQA